MLRSDASLEKPSMTIFYDEMSRTRNPTRSFIAGKGDPQHVGRAALDLKRARPKLEADAFDARRNYRGYREHLWPFDLAR